MHIARNGIMSRQFRRYQWQQLYIPAKYQLRTSCAGASFPNIYGKEVRVPEAEQNAIVERRCHTISETETLNYGKCGMNREETCSLLHLFSDDASSPPSNHAIHLSQHISCNAIGYMTVYRPSASW